MGPKERHCVPTDRPETWCSPPSWPSAPSPAHFFARKGYRTDATVSVFLGFLLFLIPAKKPCFGKKSDGERGSREEVRAGSGQPYPSQNFQKSLTKAVLRLPFCPPIAEQPPQPSVHQLGPCLHKPSSCSSSTCDPGQSQEPSLGTEPIITWKDFQKTMPWEIVILVGGGYALASGSKVTLDFYSYWANSLF